MQLETLLAFASATALGLVIFLILIGLIVLVALSRSIGVIQQGTVGVVKRLGQFHSIKEPGLVVITPILDTLTRVDVREQPWTGDHQTVIAKDNVSILVNATIFAQVIDVKKALFEVSAYEVAINTVAAASLRSVIENMTLDEVLTERELINAEFQKHVAPLTEKWGVHLNRIEVIDIIPLQSILDAMVLQKEADQKKRAVIHKSEGDQQAAINTAKGQRQAAIEIAEGQKQATILEAEGHKQAQVLIADAQRQAAILEAQGKSEAIKSVYEAIHQGDPTPDLLAVLQLETLGKVATSDNSKIVVPVESAGLLGAAQILRDFMSSSAQAPAVYDKSAVINSSTPPPPPS
jgi:regulator of protease activity HflC (stomatin/prohibitin superfamily)